jgi:para-nitrobenzyl esterase
MQAANSQGNTAPVSEDCLYLNVWTPAKKPAEKVPVIVWIYGGGFSGGSTSIPMYDGMNFAKKGVVLVSVAYRVGPFGFLAHPELSRESGKGSGNYGLEDMIAGLKWVKDNIARFGRSASVTIFGYSAGGMAVNMLAASPVTKVFPPCHLYERRVVCSTPALESRGDRNGNPGAQAGGVDG